MLTSMVTGVLGIIAPPLAAVTGLITWVFAAWMIYWTGFWARVPGAILDTRGLDPRWLAAYGCIAGAGIWLSSHWQTARYRLSRWHRQAIAGALAAGLWLALLGLVASRW